MLSQVVWTVEYTDEFGAWYARLGAPSQDAIDRAVHLIEARGPELPPPHSFGLAGARHPHLRELRVDGARSKLSIFYAADSRNTVILLIGGRITADGRFHERIIPLAERLYDRYLEEIR